MFKLDLQQKNKKLDYSKIIGYNKLNIKALNKSSRYGIKFIES